VTVGADSLIFILLENPEELILAYSLYVPNILADSSVAPTALDFPVVPDEKAI
jgi:hypothetical protein